MSNVLDFQVNGASPSKVGGTGTTIKYFQRIFGTSGPGTSIGSSPNSNISATNAAGALFLPAFNVYNGQALNIIVAGNIGNDTGDPSGTVNIQLQAVTGSLSAPVYTTIASTGAIAPAVQPSSWLLDVVAYGDSGSGVLQGYYTAQLRNATPAKQTVALDAAISGLDFQNGNTTLQRGAVLGFVVGVTFGTSDASNTSSMFQFTIES